ncbi:hypothetical protein KIH74_14830 [Kineosporia sp. J2-2]|uniref:Uncharacterized protein n=1 Tax=Kineosporia corallincola TaxID=2835133 RepID=A0ABS5TH71_9ACTN|nr:hypothetical protein [Kineosporia corallincola]MBT0770213.1 hypothetical protein [Kineosporia corallincola]
MATPDSASWHQIGVFGSGVLVERQVNSLLVRPARPTPAQAEAVAQLRVFAEAAARTGPGRIRALTVYLAPFTGISLSGMLTALREPFQRLCDDGAHQRLQIVTGADHGSTSGVNPLQALADTLRITVMAPAGTLLQIPGNTLFPVDGSGAGHWQRYEPDAPEPSLDGPWHFSAAWAGDLPLDPVSYGESDIDVVAVPAGVVLTPYAGRAGSADDVFYSVPLDPRHPLVIVDRTGDPQVTAGQIARYLRTVPEPVRRSVRLCSASSDPAPNWAQAVADELGEPVEALTGVPLLRAGEYTCCVLGPDGNGDLAVRWEPLVSRLRHSPAPGTAEITGWRSPGPDLSRSGDRVYAVDGTWVVEIVPSGVWLRRNGIHELPAPVKAPFDPVEPVLVVGSPGDQITEQIWSYAGDLADRLERVTGSRGRLRVLASPQAGRPGRGRLRLLAPTGTDSTEATGTTGRDVWQP